MEQKSCVVFCRCGANIISKNKMDEISGELKKLDVDVFELNDLCAFSVNEKDALNAIGKEFRKKMVVACYPRAVKNMLRQGGVEFGDFDVLNFKELSAGQLLAELEKNYHIPRGEARYREQVTGLEVPAWFPVIDESLCTLCGKCSRFCLFGVYSFDKKSLKVVDPLACKNNCPACGRTCPTSAIMFPRLDEKSVLAGAEPGKEKKAAGGEGLFVMLNDRNRDRKNIFRKGVMQQAEDERRKALEELKSTIARKN